MPHPPPSGPHEQRTRYEAAGPPIRSGVSGLKATIFGAYGFVGRYLVNRLGSVGTTCIIPFRGDDMEWRHLKPMGDYGNIVPVPFSPRDDDSLRRVIAQSDVVINLMGKDHETTHYVPFLKNYSFEAVNVDIPARIAEIALEEGVTNLIHMSALASHKRSASEWCRTKAIGEAEVRSIAPGATLVRPADIFGAEDRFLNLFARLQQLLHRVPVVQDGARRVQPVYVEDVAEALFRIAITDDPEVHLAQTYDLAGPEEYTYLEVIEYVLETIRAIEPTVANLPLGVAELAAEAVGTLPNPIIGRDRVLRFSEDNVLDPAAATKRLHDLEIPATSMEFPSFNFLWRFRTGGHFLDVMEAEGATPDHAAPGGAHGTFGARM